MPTPAEILAQMKRPAEWDGWVPTYSGKGYRPWADDPGPLPVGDLSYGLAYTYRYGGQSVPAITVAEHCVLVTEIIRHLWPGNEHLERAGLLHDAAESVLHDIQGPLRRRVQVVLDSGVITWNESDTRVSAKIAAYLGVSAEDLEAPEVKAADVLAASFEKRDCRNLHGEWGLPAIPEAISNLHMRFWKPQEARFQFDLVGGRLGLWGSPL
jgi:hypothetical protein